LKAHEGQARKSGEPYIEHPLHVALILVNLQLDASSLAAALLHDVEENCDIPNSEIVDKFGSKLLNWLKLLPNWANFLCKRLMKPPDVVVL